jgi:hypothetical protein
MLMHVINNDITYIMIKYDAAKYCGDGTVETDSGRKAKNGKYCKLT